MYKAKDYFSNHKSISLWVFLYHFNCSRPTFPYDVMESLLLPSFLAFFLIWYYRMDIHLWITQVKESFLRRSQLLRRE